MLIRRRQVQGSHAIPKQTGAKLRGVDRRRAEPPVRVMVPSCGPYSTLPVQGMREGFYETRHVTPFIAGVEDQTAAVVSSALPPSGYVDLIQGAVGRPYDPPVKLVNLEDTTVASQSEKLLRAPQALKELREYANGRPIQLYTFVPDERIAAVAERLDAELMSATPSVFAALSSKTGGGRYLQHGFRQTRSCADLTELAREAATLVEDEAAARSSLKGKIHRWLVPDSLARPRYLFVKGDRDSVSGLQVRRIDISGLEYASHDELVRKLDALIREKCSDLEGWIANNGVMAEIGEDRDDPASPSVQFRITPGRRRNKAEPLWTHDQIIDGTVFKGTVRPASDVEAINRKLRRVGMDTARVLAKKTDLKGDAGVDLVAARRQLRFPRIQIPLRRLGGDEAPDCEVRAVEINPRRTGASHTALLADVLLPGQDTIVLGNDNIANDAYRGIVSRLFIDALDRAGLLFDKHRDTSEGVAVHADMLESVGKVGLTILAPTRQRAEAILEEVEEILASLTEHAAALAPEGQATSDTLPSARGVLPSSTVAVEPKRHVLARPGAKYQALPRNAAFSPNGRRIATAVIFPTFAVELFDVRGKRTDRLELAARPSQVAVLDDGTVAAACADGNVYVGQSGQRPMTSVAHDDGVITALRISADGKRLAFGTNRGSLFEVELPTGRRRAVDKYSGWVRDIDYSALGARAVGSADGELRIEHPKYGTRKIILPSGVNVTRWSADGRSLAAGAGTELFIFDSSLGTTFSRDLDSKIHSVDWDPSGQKLAVAMADESIRIVDLAAGTMANLGRDSLRVGDVFLTGRDVRAVTARDELTSRPVE